MVLTPAAAGFFICSTTFMSLTTIQQQSISKRTAQSSVKLAIQKSGRLTDETIDLLRKSSLEFDAYGSRLFSKCRNFNLEILFLRDDDIPEYVQDNVCDLAIVGANIVAESMAKVSIVEKFGFGICRLSIAVPKDSSVNDIKQLAGKTIATSYPKILQQFLQKEGISAKIMQVSGSVEITPGLNIADAICDLVATGTTLRTYGLRIISTIFESEAVLIANPASLESPLRMDINRLLMRLRATLAARRNKYVMVNAPLEALPRIKQILPGLDSPTVIPLAKKDMIALHAVIPEDTFWDVIERLKKAGASGILVVPIEKMIL